MKSAVIVALSTFLLIPVSRFVSAQDVSATKAGTSTLVSIADADVSPPRPISCPDPQYPPNALALRRQGSSLLMLTVGTDGYAHDIQVVRQLDAELDERAVATVRSWRYEPARKNDQPVEVKIQVQVAFRLRAGEDRKIAELWDRADDSDPKAEWALYKAYFQGMGVPQDEALGLWFLKKAADWNLPEAQFEMGEHLYRNQSGPHDYVSAYKWYALSKRAGGEDGERMLKILAGEMSAEQLGEAETRVNYWPEDPPKRPQ